MGYAAHLLELKRSFAEMQRLGLEGGPAKEHVALAGKLKTRHCMPRLLEVMFSDRFSNRLHEIDRRPSRQDLDTNETQANASIWVDVHEEFNTPRQEYGALVSELVTFSKCNPSIIVAHDAAKLRDMWKDVTSRYNTALANSRVSGNHDNDFFSYCSGKIDVLYLHEWLRIKPDLDVTVECKLPRSARINNMGTNISDEESEIEMQGPPKKQRCRKPKSTSPTKGDMTDTLLAKLDRSKAGSAELERDCRLAQICCYAEYTTSTT
ncbi:hypothetical protein PC121_g8265 [Phytophthora cactorum]|nr:hypothetical protein PC120_g14475 [Phytophthora cactorum]KAG3074740.1 hypothetical protein PC121_g8265 [Phytophthora cactorum]